MAWTEADKDALKAAIATGAREVQYSDGSRIAYRTLKEMKETLGMMEKDISPAVTRVRTVRITGGSGLR